MPWTEKQNRWFRLCSTAKGRSKAVQKCPSIEQARKMAKEGVKKGGK